MDGSYGLLILDPWDYNKKFLSNCWDSCSLNQESPYQVWISYFHWYFIILKLTSSTHCG